MTTIATSNTCRKEFAASELVAIGQRLEEIEKPKAAEREKSGKKTKPEPCGKLPQGQETREKPTRDKVAEALGVSGPTYAKMKEVVEAASQPDAMTLNMVADEMLQKKKQQTRRTARCGRRQADASP